MNEYIVWLMATYTYVNLLQHFIKAVNEIMNIRVVVCNIQVQIDIKYNKKVCYLIKIPTYFTYI